MDLSVEHEAKLVLFCQSISKAAAVNESRINIIIEVGDTNEHSANEIFIEVVLTVAKNNHHVIKNTLLISIVLAYIHTMHNDLIVR